MNTCDFGTRNSIYFAVLQRIIDKVEIPYALERAASSEGIDIQQARDLMEVVNAEEDTDDSD